MYACVLLVDRFGGIGADKVFESLLQVCIRACMCYILLYGYA